MCVGNPQSEKIMRRIFRSTRSRLRRERSYHTESRRSDVGDDRTGCHGLGKPPLPRHRHVDLELTAVGDIQVLPSGPFTYEETDIDKKVRLSREKRDRRLWEQSHYRDTRESSSLKIDLSWAA